MLEVAPAPPVPTITVSKTKGLNPGGEVITVNGTGFSPQPPATDAVQPPLAGQFGGAYVVFGKFADTWKPSEGAPSSSRRDSEASPTLSPVTSAALR